MAHFREDDEFIYLEDDKMEFYIPMYFFDETKRYASDYYSYIETFGLFNVGLFQNGTFQEFKVLKQPYTIKVYVYDSEERFVDLPGDGETACKVLIYEKGAKVMDASIVQDATNALSFLDMMMAGKLPKSIPYDHLAGIWNKNQSMNNVGFGVRSEVEEMVGSLNYRNPKDLSQTFGSVYGKNLSLSPYAYKTINVRQICQYASTFSSLTFEDMDSMITTSVNRTRDHGTNKYSPLESILKL